MGNVRIIAEAGVNHNGNIHIAKQLIDVAAEAGVDYVKFQTFKADKLVSSKAEKANYQKTNICDNDNSQLTMLKKLELSEENHYELIHYCNTKNIQFLSTAFDLDSLDFLHKLGIKLFKIPSGEITNLLYLQKVATLAKEIIISTGMATMQEIQDALKVLVNDLAFDIKNITILHCNTEYPTPFHDVNLTAMLSIKKQFDTNIGYSDHTLGIEVPIAAVALGATIIEKHFTINKDLEGPDHKASLEPFELIAMAKAIRNIEVALGNGIKQPSHSELKNIIIARKSIHLSSDISENEIIKEEHLIMLRPGDGISPMKCNDVIGKRINKNLVAGSKLLLDDLAV